MKYLDPIGTHKFLLRLKRHVKVSVWPMCRVTLVTESSWSADEDISVHITCYVRSDVVFPLGPFSLCSLSKNLTDLDLTHGVTSRVGAQGLLRMNMAWRCLLFLSPSFFINVLFIIERRLLESFSSHERQAWRVCLCTLSSKKNYSTITSLFHMAWYWGTKPSYKNQSEFICEFSNPRLSEL